MIFLQVIVFFNLDTLPHYDISCTLYQLFIVLYTLIIWGNFEQINIYRFNTRRTIWFLGLSLNFFKISKDEKHGWFSMLRSSTKTFSSDQETFIHWSNWLLLFSFISTSRPKNWPSIFFPFCTFSSKDLFLSIQFLTSFSSTLR